MSDLQGSEVVVVLDEREVMGIASELARAYSGMVRYYLQGQGLTPAEAEQQTRQLIEEAKGSDLTLTEPPDQVTWWQLTEQMEDRPEMAIAAWERVKHAARDELAGGVRAATAIHGVLGRPWDRARFLAIREAFRKEWQPSDGIEAALVDALAQAHYVYLFWLERLMSRAMFEAQYEDGDLRREGKWRLPRVMDVDAQNQAVAMADRFNRLFMRTLRGLRDLRRYAPSVMIQSAAQVNIGEQQVNIADRRVGDSRPPEPSGDEPYPPPLDHGEQ